MMVKFNICPPPGAEEATRLELDAARCHVREELWRNVDELHEAKRTGDEIRIHELTHRILPSLWLRARSVGLREFPKRLATPIKVGKVRWKGEEALRHLESLGFRRPSSKQKLNDRVHACVRKLILKGKGDSLPDRLFDIPLALILDTY